MAGITIFDELEGLASYRKRLDGMSNAWAEALTDEDLSCEQHYANMQGIKANKRLGAVLMHFFNHQTHHRGQAHAILTLLGVPEPDGLDLLLMQRERG